MPLSEAQIGLFKALSNATLVLLGRTFGHGAPETEGAKTQLDTLLQAAIDEPAPAPDPPPELHRGRH